MLINRLFLWLSLHPQIFWILSTSVILFCRVDTIHAEEFTTTTEEEITSKDSYSTIKEIVLVACITLIAAFFIGWITGFFPVSPEPVDMANEAVQEKVAKTIFGVPKDIILHLCAKYPKLMARFLSKAQPEDYDYEPEA